MAAQERLYTAAEFSEIAQRAENADKRLELIDGVIVEMPPSSQKNAVIAIRFARFLGNLVDEHDLGWVTGADGGYKISEHNTFQPDAAFISKSRHKELEGVEFPVAPDLAVEVISPSESSNDVIKKVRRYIEAGTLLVWTAYADEETVYAWQAAPDGGLHMQTFGKDDTLDGSPALPGLTLKVSDIFPK
jgi:Uma2 family endonuclease